MHIYIIGIQRLCNMLYHKLNKGVILVLSLIFLCSYKLFSKSSNATQSYFITHLMDLIVYNETGIGSTVTSRENVTSQMLKNQLSANMAKFSKVNSTVVKGAPYWQYVFHIQDKPHIFIHTQAWLDIRPEVTNTHCLRVSFLYEREIFREYILKNRDKLRHRGIIVYNKKMYKLIGHVAFYNNFRCTGLDGEGETAYCRHVIDFILPFKATYDDYVNGLLRKFLYISNILQDAPNRIDITIPPLEKSRGKFFVCSRPLYGSFSKQTVRYLVEWVEMHKLLGVDVIYIYNSSLTSTPEVQRFFDYYQKEGTMFLKDFVSPFHKKINKSDINTEFIYSVYSDPAALNDCFFRHMNMYEYMIIVDTDEIIIPVKHQDYFTLFDELFSNATLKSYYKNAASIYNTWAFFLDDFNKMESISKVTSYRKFAPTPLTRGKSFTSTKYCSYAGQHTCAIQSSVNREVRTPYNLVKTHHYRNKCKKENGCKSEIFETADYVLRYKDTLGSIISEVYRKLEL